MKKTRNRLAAWVILAAVLLAGAGAAQGGTLAITKNGDIVTISGTTNLAAGDRLMVNVVSSAFTPTEKGAAGGFSGSAGTVTVQPGMPLNVFSFDMNVSAFQPGEYLVTVESVEPRLLESARFILPWPTVPAGNTSLPATVSATLTTPRAPTTLPAMQPSPTTAPLPVVLSLWAIALATLIFLRRG